jgi:DNA replication and repair protein RecF
VWVTRLRLRDFRSYASADVPLSDGLTVIYGHNGAGKTNLLEALYFGCTGRSPRTSNEREVVRFGAPATRVVVDSADEHGATHQLTVGFAPGQAKRLLADGAPVETLLDAPGRPLVCLFLPDRLELVKGPPALRRSHVDALITALWPARAETRRAYARALAQRNALLARIRAGRASVESLAAWDAELARHGVTLREQRAEAVGLLAGPFAKRASQLGLTGPVELQYRPRSRAVTADELVAELGERHASDLERGFTGHGPHRDELLFLREARELRAYGSQGEQRLALLALLLAERDVLNDQRGLPPLMLLDDVMSELDPTRRELLSAELVGSGQSLVTSTELSHVPGAGAPDVRRLAVSEGMVLTQARAA